VSRLRILFVLSMLVVVVLVLGSGCRDATQVTLDISLAKNALCTETSGTAITVGVDPLGTEDRVAHEFVTATTSSCDQATREIGTLVLTPSGSGRASVIVVVAYGGGSPAACKPPLFKGCIVARRQFSFTDHKHVEMPITIDPDCKDVPCDAFSTCRTGKCFSAEASCVGDACIEPGDPGDGGTAVDGQVIPDTGVPIDGATDGQGLDGAMSDGAMGDGAVDDGGGDSASSDSGSDGGGGNPAGVWCNLSDQLECPNPFTCIGSTSCCGPADNSSALCRGTVNACVGTEHQYCCGTTTCPGGKLCVFAAGVGVQQIIPRWNMLPLGTTAAGTCQ